MKLGSPFDSHNFMGRSLVKLVHVCHGPLGKSLTEGVVTPPSQKSGENKRDLQGLV